MGNQKVREKKKPTFFLAVLPILAMILLLGVGYAVTVSYTHLRAHETSVQRY